MFSRTAFIVLCCFFTVHTEAASTNPRRDPLPSWNDGAPKQALTAFINKVTREGSRDFIGRRPIAAFGNSDGDKAMLEYTTIDNPRPSFGMIIHHTDAEREYAYDARPKSCGKLVEALADAPARGWVVVDMAKDWSNIFVP